MDIAGIDVLAHVMRNLNERLTSEADRGAFAVPPIVDALLQRGALGEAPEPALLDDRRFWLGALCGALAVAFVVTVWIGSAILGRYLAGVSPIP